MNDWKTLELKFKAKEAEYSGASETRKQEIATEYDVLLKEIDTIVPELRKLAIESYEKDPNKDESVLRFLVGAMTDDLSNKRYDDFFALGELLNKGNCDVKHLEAIKQSKRLNSFGINDPVDEVIARRNDMTKNDLPRAVIKTSYGDIEIELFEDSTPNHVANFVSLVTEKKYYDGSEWHRVDPANRVVQGGKPAEGITPIDYTLAAEWDTPDPRLHFKGSIGAARVAGQPNSASSQFYIMTDRFQPFDGNYTGFWPRNFRHGICQSNQGWRQDDFCRDHSKTRP